MSVTRVFFKGERIAGSYFLNSASGRWVASVTWRLPHRGPPVVYDGSELGLRERLFRIDMTVSFAARLRMFEV